MLSRRYKSIHDAAAFGTVDDIVSFVSEQPDLVSSRNNDDMLPVYIAASECNIATLEYFIKNSNTHDEGLVISFVCLHADATIRNRTLNALRLFLTLEHSHKCISLMLSEESFTQSQYEQLQQSNHLGVTPYYYLVISGCESRIPNNLNCLPIVEAAVDLSDADRLDRIIYQINLAEFYQVDQRLSIAINIYIDITRQAMKLNPANHYDFCMRISSYYHITALLFLENKEYENSLSMNSSAIIMLGEIVNKDSDEYLYIMVEYLKYQAGVMGRLKRFTDQMSTCRSAENSLDAIMDKNTDHYKSLRAKILYYLANSYDSCMQYSIALEYYKKAIDLSKGVINQTNESHLNDLASFQIEAALCSANFNDSNTSIQYFIDSIKTLKLTMLPNNTPHHIELASCLNNLSHLYVKIKSYELARSCLAEAIGFYEHLAVSDSKYNEHITLCRQRLANITRFDNEDKQIKKQVNNKTNSPKAKQSRNKKHVKPTKNLQAFVRDLSYEYQSACFRNNVNSFYIKIPNHESFNALSRELHFDFLEKCGATFSIDTIAREIAITCNNESLLVKYLSGWFKDRKNNRFFKNIPASNNDDTRENNDTEFSLCDADSEYIISKLTKIIKGAHVSIDKTTATIDYSGVFSINYYEDYFENEFISRTARLKCVTKWDKSSQKLSIDFTKNSDLNRYSWKEILINPARKYYTHHSCVNDGSRLLPSATTKTKTATTTTTTATTTATTTTTTAAAATIAIAATTATTTTARTATTNSSTSNSLHTSIAKPVTTIHSLYDPVHYFVATLLERKSVTKPSWIQSILLNNKNIAITKIVMNIPPDTQYKFHDKFLNILDFFQVLSEAYQKNTDNLKDTYGELRYKSVPGHARHLVTLSVSNAFITAVNNQQLPIFQATLREMLLAVTSEPVAILIDNNDRPPPNRSAVSQISTIKPVANTVNISNPVSTLFSLIDATLAMDNQSAEKSDILRGLCFSLIHYIYSNKSAFKTHHHINQIDPEQLRVAFIDSINPQIDSAINLVAVELRDMYSKQPAVSVAHHHLSLFMNQQPTSSDSRIALLKKCHLYLSKCDDLKKSMAFSGLTNYDEIFNDHYFHHLDSGSSDTLKAFFQAQGYLIEFRKYLRLLLKTGFRFEDNDFESVLALKDFCNELAHDKSQHNKATGLLTNVFLANSEVMKVFDKHIFKPTKKQVATTMRQ